MQIIKICMNILMKVICTYENLINVASLSKKSCNNYLGECLLHKSTLLSRFSFRIVYCIKKHNIGLLDGSVG